MFKIKLTKGFYAIVDEDDYKSLSKHKWCIGNHGYALRRVDNRIVLMHRLICGATKGQMVDHINRRKLDNRRKNLRTASKQGNAANSKKRNYKSSSRYKGVTYIENSNKYLSRITVNYKTIRLGLYKSETEAARAYDEAAEDFFGDFSNTNQI